MQITLPPEAQAVIDRKLASGEYSTVEDVIAEALLQFDEGIVVYDPMSDPRLQESIAQADRGEVMAWTEELRADIRRQALANARAGKPVSDDITY